MKYTVLLTAPYMIPSLERFKPVFEKYDIDLIVPDVEERMEESDLLKYAVNSMAQLAGMTDTARVFWTPVRRASKSSQSGGQASIPSTPQPAPV